MTPKTKASDKGVLTKYREATGRYLGFLAICCWKVGRPRHYGLQDMTLPSRQLTMEWAGLACPHSDRKQTRGLGYADRAERRFGPMIGFLWESMNGQVCLADSADFCLVRLCYPVDVPFANAKGLVHVCLYLSLRSLFWVFGEAPRKGIASWVTCMHRMMVDLTEGTYGILADFAATCE